MSRSSQNGVGIALGAVAALSVGSALLQKRGSRHTYGVPAEEKGKWTYLYAQRFFTNVKNPERGKPVGNYYRRMFAGPGYGTQKGPEYFSIYDHGVERVRIRKGGLWDIFPPTSTSSWGDNYAINRYTPAYVRRIQGVDFIATQGVPPKVPDRWNYTPGAGYRRIAGYKNPNVVEIPFMSTTTVDVHGAVVYQLAHHDPPSRVQRARISKALNELIRRGVDNNTELLEGDLLSASSVRDVYRFREIDFSDTWLEVYNLEGNRIQGGEFVAKSTPPVLCPQCDGDDSLIRPLYKPFTSLIRPLYRPFTSLIRPLYRPFTSLTRPLYRPFTSLIRPLYRPFTSLIRPLYRPFTSLIIKATI